MSCAGCDLGTNAKLRLSFNLHTGITGSVYKFLSGTLESPIHVEATGNQNNQERN